MFTCLKVKSAKCIFLYFRWSWSCSCYFYLCLVSSGLGLGFKNLILFTSLVLSLLICSSFPFVRVKRKCIQLIQGMTGNSVRVSSNFTSASSGENIFKIGLDLTKFSPQLGNKFHDALLFGNWDTADNLSRM